MKISKIIFTHFIFFFILYFYGTSYAGPFGTEMGDTPSKFTGLTANMINNYEQVFSTIKMPKTHSQFVKYELTFRSSGLCKIRAFSHKYTNSACNETLEIFNALKRQLSSKYKAPSKSEVILNERIKAGERGFCSYLLKRHFYWCDWTDNLPDNIKGIRLIILAYDDETSAVALLIEYKNIDEPFEVKDIEADLDAL